MGEHPCHFFFSAYRLWSPFSIDHCQVNWRYLVPRRHPSKLLMPCITLNLSYAFSLGTHSTPEFLPFYHPSNKTMQSFMSRVQKGAKDSSIQYMFRLVGCQRIPHPVHPFPSYAYPPQGTRRSTKEKRNNHKWFIPSPALPTNRSSIQTRCTNHKLKPKQINTNFPS